MPTQFYQHKSNDLWSQYQSGLIDHKKYLEMLAAIKAEEINKEVSSGKAFAGTREQISNDIWNYENKQREAREKAERLKSLAPLERYKEEIPETITRYRNDANA